MGAQSAQSEDLATILDSSLRDRQHLSRTGTQPDRTIPCPFLSWRSRVRTISCLFSFSFFPFSFFADLLFQGCVYVFSLYYPRHLRHFRVSIFFSGAALAG